MGRLGAKKGRGIWVIRADHVGVQDGDDGILGDDRMEDVIPRPNQPLLLGAMPDKQGGPPSGMLGEGLPNRQDPDADAPVVIGPIPNRIARHRGFDPIMILVGAEEDILAPYSGIGAGDLGDHIDRRIGEAIEKQGGRQPLAGNQRRSRATLEPDHGRGRGGSENRLAKRKTVAAVSVPIGHERPGRVGNGIGHQNDCRGFGRGEGGRDLRGHRKDVAGGANGDVVG